MAGLYIHIPFCKQACYYCDFHFSTSLKKKDAMLMAIKKELELRCSEVGDQIVPSIYFGGGTPSLLESGEIVDILEAIHKLYKLTSDPEISLEANPDDLNESKLKELSDAGINRLSLGIQSFQEEDLRLMNRAHSSRQAYQSLEDALKYFENISADLIYGIPGSGSEKWDKNLRTLLDYPIPHISSYALTVEPRTALRSFIDKGIIPDVDEYDTEQQFKYMVDLFEENGFIHYEISNFGRPGFFSINNTAYWKGEPYLGIGPSAHSFDGRMRSWNIRNNNLYIKSIKEDILPAESEKLSKRDRYNEYIMTGLRTIWGVSLQRVQEEFGEKFKNYLSQQAGPYIQDELLSLEGDRLFATKKGKFLIDGIASHLFMLNLGS